MVTIISCILSFFAGTIVGVVLVALVSCNDDGDN